MVIGSSRGGRSHRPLGGNTPGPSRNSGAGPGQVFPHRECGRGAQAAGGPTATFALMEMASIQARARDCKQNRGQHPGKSAKVSLPTRILLDFCTGLDSDSLIHAPTAATSTALAGSAMRPDLACAIGRKVLPAGTELSTRSGSAKGTFHPIVQADRALERAGALPANDGNC